MRCHALETTAIALMLIARTGYSQPNDVDFSVHVIGSYASLQAFIVGEYSTVFWYYGNGDSDSSYPSGQLDRSLTRVINYESPGTYNVRLDVDRGDSVVSVTHWAVITPESPSGLTASGSAFCPFSVSFFMHTYNEVNWRDIERVAIDLDEGCGVQNCIWSWGGGNHPPYSFQMFPLAASRFCQTGIHTVTITNYYYQSAGGGSQTLSASFELISQDFVPQVQQVNANSVYIRTRDQEGFVGYTNSPDSVRINWGDGIDTVASWISQSNGRFNRSQRGHTYGCPGTYEITVHNYYIGPCTQLVVTRSVFVDVGGINPVAAFSIVQDECTETIQFQDESIGATSWMWDFGDNMSSTQQNPTHTYELASTIPQVFEVQIVINSGPCMREHSQIITVQPGLHADFEYLPDPGNAAQINFTNVSTGSPTGFYWNFGDGTTSTIESPSHTYLLGCSTYCVNFGVLGQEGCTSSFSTTIIVPSPQLCSRPRVLLFNGPRLPEDHAQLLEAEASFALQGWEPVVYEDGTEFDILGRLSLDNCIKGIYYVGHGDDSGKIVFSSGADGGFGRHISPEELAVWTGPDMEFATIIACYQDQTRWDNAYPRAIVDLCLHTNWDGTCNPVSELDALYLTGHGARHPSCRICGAAPQSQHILSTQYSRVSLDEGECPTFRICDSAACGTDLYPVSGCADSTLMLSTPNVTIEGSDGMFESTVYYSITPQDSQTVATAASYFADVPQSLICPGFRPLGRYLCYATVEADSSLAPDSFEVILRYSDIDLASAGVTHEDQLIVIWSSEDTTGFQQVAANLDTQSNEVSFSTTKWGVAGIYERLTYEGVLESIISDVDAASFPDVVITTLVDSNGVSFTGLQAANFEIIEDGVTVDSMSCFLQLGHFAITDIVFVVDVSTNMGPYIASVVSELSAFMSGPTDTSLYRFGLITYGQNASPSPSQACPSGSYYGGPRNRSIEGLQTAQWVHDQLAPIVSPAGGKEPAYHAIHCALNSSLWRPNSSRYVVLVTNENNDFSTNNGNPGCVNAPIPYYSVTDIQNSFAASGATFLAWCEFGTVCDGHDNGDGIPPESLPCGVINNVGCRSGWDDFSPLANSTNGGIIPLSQNFHDLWVMIPPPETPSYLLCYRSRACCIDSVVHNVQVRVNYLDVTAVDDTSYLLSGCPDTLGIPLLTLSRSGTNVMLNWNHPCSGLVYEVRSDSLLNGTFEYVEGVSSESYLTVQIGAGQNERRFFKVTARTP